MITVGAQSGDPNRLLQLKRAHTLSDIKNAVHLINQFELMANLDFIIAYPDEDRAERKRTFAFIEYLNRQYRVKIQFHHFFPLSGSHMQFRFPSRLDNQSRLDLQNIFLNGIGRKGWVQNEIDSDRFFSWLRRRSYSQFKKYQ